MSFIVFEFRSTEYGMGSGETSLSTNQCKNAMGNVSKSGTCKRLLASENVSRGVSKLMGKSRAVPSIILKALIIATKTVMARCDT